MAGMELANLHERVIPPREPERNEGTKLEIDSRGNDGLVVTAFLYPGSGKFEILVFDTNLGTRVTIPATPENWKDIFHHPNAALAAQDFDREKEELNEAIAKSTPDEPTDWDKALDGLLDLPEIERGLITLEVERTEIHEADIFKGFVRRRHMELSQSPEEQAA